jgi:hypothetical protein
MMFWGGVGRIMSVTGFSVIAAFTMISLLPLKLSDTGIVVLGSKLAAIVIVTFFVHLVVSSLFSLEEVGPIVNKVKQIVLWPIKIQ